MTLSAAPRARIAPCLWFDFNAEEAVAFYTGVFPDSRITHVSHYGAESPEHQGKVLMIEFELNGQAFQALNGGPMFKFNEAISLSVDCADQAEVDRVWEALTADGGQGVQCGWLKDRFGVSWQIVPRIWWDIMHSPEKAAVQRAFVALFGMQKMDVAALEKAFRG
ncbi:MAG: VOC family protein [Betaproteobacteria bacterium]|nr:VOC family protein [Betaproteobacteria bacterium]